MAKCDPNDAIPTTCVAAFQQIRDGHSDLQAGQAAQNAKLEAIHDETRKTNGHVAKLFEHSDAHGKAIAVLQAQQSGVTVWGRRIWQLIIGLMLLAAGYFLKGS